MTNSISSTSLPQGAPPAQPALLPVGNEDATPPKDKRFFWLTVGQYAVLGLVGIGFAYFLVNGAIGSNGENLEKLKDIEIARGLITYLVAVATVAIATIMAMAAILSGGKDLDKRFAMGKEVLTLLIGVLGTIIGFYYGKTATTAPVSPPAAIQIAPATLTPEHPLAGSSFKLSTTLTGGAAPYTYSIKFDSGEITPVEKQLPEPQTSVDGRIEREFTVPKGATPGGTVGFVIEGKDKNGTQFSNKDGRQKITLGKQ